jgi:cell division septation protein DedD
MPLKPCDDMKRKHKKVKILPPKKQGSWRRQLGILVVFSLLFAAGLVIFHHKIHPVDYRAFKASYARLNAWLHDRSAHFHEEINEAKARAERAERLDDVHFEFYTALPAMQMKAPAMLPIKSTAAITPLPATEVSSSSSQSVAHALLQKPFVNADEIEKEFAAKLQPNINYILQLGIFRELKSAQALRANMMAAGLSPSIHQLGRGEKSLFRVQLGPYSSLSQAKNTAHQLQRKGFSVLLRKLNE